MPRPARPKPQYGFDVIADRIDFTAKSLSSYTQLKPDGIDKAIASVTKSLPRQINHGFKTSKPSTGTKRKKSASAKAGSSTPKRGKNVSASSTPSTQASSRPPLTRSSRSTPPPRAPSSASSAADAYPASTAPHSPIAISVQSMKSGSVPSNLLIVF